MPVSWTSPTIRRFYQRGGRVMVDENRYKYFVELVRRVRHDANNPITAALGHVQLLLDDPNVTDPEVRESLTIIEGEMRRLTEIIRRLNEVKE